MIFEAIKCRSEIKKNDFAVRLCCVVLVFFSVADVTQHSMNLNHNRKKKESKWSKWLQNVFCVKSPSASCEGRITKNCYEHRWNGNYKNNHNKCFYLYGSRLFFSCIHLQHFVSAPKTKKNLIQALACFFRCFYIETKWKTKNYFNIFREHFSVLFSIFFKVHTALLFFCVLSLIFLSFDNM